jgi:L-2-amino-thiazoline-4-carboxylic acid hydrolase
MTSAEQDLRRQLKEAHMSRAMVYAAFYEALAERCGADLAEEVMKQAIYRRGLEIGRRFASFGPDDLAGLCAAFLDFVPDQGRLFQPEVRRADDQALDIKFHACPLKEAWQAAGLSDARIATLCRIAGVVDNGTFEAAGFAFSAETWQPGVEGCCFLHIRPGKAGPG